MIFIKLGGETSQQQQQQLQQNQAANNQVDFINQDTIKYIEKNTYFIDRRKQEIMLLLNSGYLTDDAKLKLQCEIKFLETSGFYHQLKDNILSEYKRNNKPNRGFERMFLDRKYFTREKPARKQEAKMMEKFELHLRNEQEQKKKIRHKDFLQALYSHQAEFFEFHKKKAKNLKRRTIHAKNYLETLEKKRILI